LTDNKHRAERGQDAQSSRRMNGGHDGGDVRVGGEQTEKRRVMLIVAGLSSGLGVWRSGEERDGREKDYTQRGSNLEVEDRVDQLGGAEERLRTRQGKTCKVRAAGTTSWMEKYPQVWLAQDARVLKCQFALTNPLPVRWCWCRLQAAQARWQKVLAGWLVGLLAGREFDQGMVLDLLVKSGTPYWSIHRTGNRCPVVAMPRSQLEAPTFLNRDRDCPLPDHSRAPTSTPRPSSRSLFW